MNKHLMVLGIVVLLILVVGLSGCIENPIDAEKNKFVGTWVSEHLGSDYMITFSSDGKYESHNHIWGNGVYDVKDGQLVLSMSNSDMVFTMNYRFSNADKTFTLMYDSEDSLTFEKQ